MKQKCIYTPAMQRYGLSGVTRSIFENGIEINGQNFSPKVWDKTLKTFFYHPTVLVSAYYGMSNPDYRKYLGIDKTGLLVVDSGGFQILKMGITLDPLKVLRWQENNGDIILSLDVPPVTKDGSAAPTRLSTMSVFKQAAEQSYSNNKIYETERRNHEAKFYVVIQGGELERLQFWWDKMKDFKWEGYAIAPKPTADPLNIAMHLSFLINNGVTENVHVLGVSGFNILPILASASTHINNLTFDTSTYTLGIRFRKFTNPLHPSQWINFGDNFNRNLGLKEPPCVCPVCENVESVDFFNGEGTLPGVVMNFHNLYTHIKEVEILNRLVTCEKLFDSFVTTKYPSRTVEGINFIRESVENGFEKTYLKYRASFRHRRKTVKYGALV